MGAIICKQLPISICRKQLSKAHTCLYILNVVTAVTKKGVADWLCSMGLRYSWLFLSRK